MVSSCRAQPEESAAVEGAAALGVVPLRALQAWAQVQRPHCALELDELHQPAVEQALKNAA